MLGTWAGTVHLERRRKINLKCQEFKRVGGEKKVTAMGLRVIYKYGRSRNKEGDGRRTGWLGRLEVNLEPFPSLSVVCVQSGG